MNQNRFKSPIAWGALIALVLFVLKTYSLLQPIGLTEDSFKELTTLIFTAATAFGILNNPTSKDEF
ncbi:MAG TPA: phage holin [Desulfitobacteriaceae bacterium]|nr:phage holin [Desulfitobacteriaceae bacterium]